MKYIVICLIFVLTSCSRQKPVEIPGFDNESFKTDRGGCELKRIGSLDILKQNKDKFLGMSENSVFATLGRYDYQILDKRNEKIFIYFIEKGPHCEFIQNESSALRMVIYLNSVSLVKEIGFQNTNP